VRPHLAQPGPLAVKGPATVDRAFRRAFVAVYDKDGPALSAENGLKLSGHGLYHSVRSNFLIYRQAAKASQVPPPEASKLDLSADCNFQRRCPVTMTLQTLWQVYGERYRR